MILIRWCTSGNVGYPGNKDVPRMYLAAPLEEVLGDSRIVVFNVIHTISNRVNLITTPASLGRVPPAATFL